MKRPMILSAAVCILLSLLLINADSSVLIIVATLCFNALIFLMIFKKTRVWAIIIALSFLFLLSMVRLNISYIDEFKYFRGKQLKIEAVVTDVTIKEEYSSLKVKVTESKEVPRGTRLSLVYYNGNFTVGNELTAEVKLWPIDKAGKKYNYADRVFASGRITKIVDTRYGDNIYHKLHNFKTRVTGALFSELDYEKAAFCSALTVGNKEYISDDFYSDVRRSGVSHVIVVSGMHMSIICGSIYTLLNKIRFNKQASAIMTLLFMLFFMALCGFTPSVLRAGLMYGVFLLSRIFLQKGDGLNSLSIAVTIMLILNPYLIWDVGFLLSAASTFGIIVILPIIEGYIDKFVKCKWLNWLLKLSSITVSALITTVPISVYYFGEISSVAVFTNIAISFAVTVLLILVVIGIALHLISGSNFLVSMLFTASSVISSYIIFVIKFFSSLPFAAIPCKMWAIMLIYILILAIFIILKYTYIIRKEKRSV